MWPSKSREESCVYEPGVEWNRKKRRRSVLLLRIRMELRGRIRNRAKSMSICKKDKKEGKKGETVERETGGQF